MTVSPVFGSQPYDYTIQPGAFVPIAALGSMVRVTAATGDFKLGFNRQSRGRWFVGKAYRTPPGFTFQSVEIENDGAVAISVTVEITLGDIINDRFVLDPGAEVAPRHDLAALIEAPAAIGRTLRGPAVGVFSFGQLFNPAASGVLLEIAEIEFRSSTGVNYAVARSDVQTGVAGGEDFIDTRQAGTPTGEVTMGTAAAFGALWFAQVYTAGTVEKIVWPEGFRPKLAEGTGMLIRPNTVNQGFSAEWRWREVPLS